MKILSPVCTSRGEVDNINSYIPGGNGKKAPSLKANPALKAGGRS